MMVMFALAVIRQIAPIIHVLAMCYEVDPPRDENCAGLTATPSVLMMRTPTAARDDNYVSLNETLDLSRFGGKYL